MAVPTRQVRTRPVPLLFALILGACGFHALNNDHVWWQITLGEWVWSHRQIPEIGTFSLNAESIFPFYDTFGSVALYLTYELAGVWGLVMLRIVALFTVGLLLAKAAYGPIAHAHRLAYLRSAATFVSLGLVGAIILPFAEIDTRLFSLVFSALFLYILRREERRPRSRLLWILPFAQLVWAQCDQYAAFGLLLVGAQSVRTFFRVDDRRLFSRFALNAFFCGLTLLSVPSGIDLVRVPLMELFIEGTSSYALNGGLYLSPRSLFNEYPSFILMVLIWLLPRKKNSRHSWLERVPGGLFIFLSYWIDLIPYVAISLLPGVTRRLEMVFIWQLGRQRDRLRPTAAAAISTFIGCMTMVYTYVIHYSPEVRHAAVSTRLPVEASRFLNTHPIPGHMYNSISLGSYLIHSLAPEQKVFVDSRGANAFYSKDLIARASKAAGDEETWNELVHQKNVTHVILHYDPEKPTYAFLHESPQWHLVYWDDAVAILVKKDERTAEFIAKHAFKTIRVGSTMGRIANWQWEDAGDLLSDLKENVRRNPSSYRAKTMLELAEHAMAEAKP